MSDFIKRQVAELFANVPDRGEIFENPVTGEKFVPPDDPIEPHLERAERALRARLQFAAELPPDAPELPLKYSDRELLKCGERPLPYIMAWFARSLSCRDYFIAGHPGFVAYARGVMASPHTPRWVKEDAEMLRRYPPAPLKGLGRSLICSKL
jgi:hypothetical protein